MKCKICDLLIDNNKNKKVPITNLLTKSTGYSYRTILESFFDKSSMVYFSDLWNTTSDKENLVCKTCENLIEYYDKFYYEAKICYDLIMRQLHRTLKISKHNEEPSKQSVHNEFSILTQYDNDKEMLYTFKKKLNIFYCQKCEYQTIYSDTLVGHYKYHKLPKIIKTNDENEIAVDELKLENEEKSENESKSYIDIIKQSPHNEIPSELLCNLTDTDQRTINEHSTGSDCTIKKNIPLQQNYVVVVENNNETEETNDSIIVEHINDLNAEENIITKPNLVDVADITADESDYDALSHSEAHDDPSLPIKCLNCNITLPTRKRMEKHYMRAHNFCFKCNIQFMTKMELQKHRYTTKHTGLYKCNLCSIKFKSKMSREKHECEQKAKKKAKKRAIESEFTGKCKYCGKQLNTPSSLKSHEWVHRTNPKYVCVTCGLIFNNSATFNLHEKYHISDKPFSCDFCPLKLASHSSLKVHMRIHTGERPYKCEYCDKDFKILAAKKEHLIAVHTKEYRLKCDICGKNFMTLNRLRQHKLTVHKQNFPIKKCEYKVKVRKTKLLEALE